MSVGTAAPGGSAGDAAQALARVRQVLLEHGVEAEEIDRAVADDVLDLLAIDCVLVPGAASYDLHQVAGLTGISPDLALRLWRALGFSDVAPGQRAFTDLDIEALFLVRALVQLGVADFDSAISLARVIGSSMARIAESEMSPAVAGLPGVGVAEADSVTAAARVIDLAPTTLPAIARLLEFCWRRHLRAAAWRAGGLRRRAGPAQPVLALGFADMVGFTVLSQQLSEPELAAVVSRFEEVAHDTVTRLGGRVVKMIGDEAMFVCDDPVAAAEIGLRLAEVYAADDLLSDVRVGIAWGPVLVQDGDFFGPVVNLASRVVTIAHPGSVLISDELHGELARRGVLGGSQPADGDEPGLGAVALRARSLKDVGKVQLWALFRPGAPRRVPARVGRRWERLSEVLRDLDELRLRGEQAIATGRISAPIGPGGGQPHGGEAPRR